MVVRQVGDQLSGQVDVTVVCTHAKICGGRDRCGGLHRSGDWLASRREDDSRGGLQWVAVVLVSFIVTIV